MSRPPRIPLLILKLFAGKAIFDELEGDLYEDFLDNLEHHGERKARSIYTWTALSSVRPYLWKHNLENRKPKYLDMVIYHLKMALRKMVKNRSYSLINIFGLTTGLACNIAILLFVVDQLRLDGHQVNQERIYRLEAEQTQNGVTSRKVHVHSFLLPAIAAEIPGIEAFARVTKTNRIVIQKTGNTKNLVEETVLFANSNLFKVFNFEIVQGKQQHLLETPTELVITESAAKRYFGNEDPIGKVVEFNTQGAAPRTVVAVVHDPAGDSSIKFDFIANSAELFPPGGESSFESRFALSTPVYLLLKPGISAASVASQILPELKKHTDKESLIGASYSLNPFASVKYDIDVSDRIIEPVDKRIIIMFVLVAVFIISLATINYINISSAQALHRAQEIGIRKVIGANKKTLFSQFIVESFCICILSLSLSLILLEIIIPWFEKIMERPLFFKYWSDPYFLMSLLAFVLFFSFSAGLYPALILMKFKFVHFIKGRISHDRKGMWLRRSLAIFQFTFSIGLIIGALLVQKQLNFIKQQTLDYAPEQLLVVHGEFGVFSKNYQTVKAEIAQISAITGVTVTNSSPGDNRYMTSGRKEIPERFIRYVVDEDYLDLFNLKVVKGQQFNPLIDTAGTDVLINEAMASILSIPDPVNSTAYRFFGKTNNKIIGIVEDFYFESLHNEIKPVMFTQAHSFTPVLSQYIVRVNTENFEEVIPKLEAIWAEFYPNALFDFEFMDDKIDRLYSSEYRLSRIFGIFTVLAIVISCLGLFGLSTIMAEAKIKEISIRKVLGATRRQLIQLLSRQVYLVILVAALLGTPLAYYFIKGWLEGFAYSTPISIPLFIITVLSSLALGLITTFWHTYKTARANPADILRNE